MRSIKKNRLKQVALLTTLLFSAASQAVTVGGKEYTDYHACVAGRNTAGSQVNDECFLAFDKFIAVGNPVTANRNVYIDETHHNFHTISAGTKQRYLPFAKLLEKGGYTVSAVTGGATEFINWLNANPGATLVIANPLHASNDPEANWLGTIESAFTEEEISKLVAWVKAGGSLMLIADHFPFPGSVAELGKKFGFYMDNGYNFDPNYNNDFLYSLLLSSESFLAGHSYNPVADIMLLKRKTTDLSPDGGMKLDTKTNVNKPRTVKDDLVDIVRLIMVKLGADVNSLVFWAGEQPSTANGFAAGDGTLTDHPIVRGRAGKSETTPYVTSFTGQSFTYVPPAASEQHSSFTKLMVLGKSTYTLLTTSQDAYFGDSQSDSESNLVTYALTNQKIAPYTVAEKNTGGDSSKGLDPSLQGAAVNVGSGKLVVFGEAGMFTAQIAADGSSQMGFNNPMAANNQQFVLNTVNWLSGNLTTASAASTATTNTGLPTASAYMAPTGTTIDLRKVVTTVAANVEEFKVYQEDMKDGVYNGNKSYAVTYRQNYSSGGGGGCTLNPLSSGDPVLPLLALMAMGYLFRPRKQHAK